MTDGGATLESARTSRPRSRLLANRLARGVAFVIGMAALAGAGCGTSNYMELPDLATQSPSKQAVMSPTDQKKAIDELIAKRDKQAADAARAAEAEQSRK